MKTTFINGLLLHFLLEQNWVMLIGLFMLTYLIGSTFLQSMQNMQHKMERDKFEQMAYTDYLTGVFNRAYMEKQMLELNQKREAVGVVVTDIDRFKKINDRYNHLVGDQVIIHFAKTIQALLDKEDVLIRSGGEEFTIFLRNRSFEACVALVEQIRQEIERSIIRVEFGENIVDITYSASFGLSYRNANNADPVEKNYVKADNLLLRSKQHGRNLISYEEDAVTLPQSVNAGENM
ncbi:diguanylate cyclase [Brevibacillus fulvus]|uniref:Diguanylate cyclase (GGDEF)-like protein n=1 Tax=Brevibacillus fulvus TaxID=1125967 RepID=A0A939BQW1_9BACL|nr:diguanylate cyclase (GGDEF)-like protein [Brevibacillus fulvus]